MNSKDLYKVNGSESELGMIWEPEAEEEFGRFRTGLRRPQQRRPALSRRGLPRPKQPVRRTIPRQRRRRPLPINYGTPVFTEPQSASSEYVRWVQTMLNQVLNLRLPVHGLMDVQTRSSVR